MKYYISLLMSLIFAFSWAQPTQERLESYARQLDTVRTLRSHFTEEKHLSLLDAPIQSQGEFSFDKNAQKLRWQYRQPFENGFLIEKERVYRLHEKEKKSVDNARGRMFMAEMLVWLTLDFEAIKKNYSVTLNGSEITFVPLSKEHKIVKKITVYLDPKDVRVVTRVKMEEPGGDFIVWKFSNTQINPTLSDEVFQ